LPRLHVEEVQRSRWEAIATESLQDPEINPAEVGEASLNIVGDPVRRDQLDQELMESPSAESVEVLDAPLKAIGRGDIVFRVVERGRVVRGAAPGRAAPFVYGVGRIFDFMKPKVGKTGRVRHRGAGRLHC
jgi:hypothetical protein